MQIKFGLPNGAGGAAAAHGAGRIRTHLREFSRQTNCEIRTWSFHKDYRHWLGAEIPPKYELLFRMFFAEIPLFMDWQLLDD